MRALPLIYPDDPTLATCDLEYLFGPDLLVAPIYNAAGKRPVVFPPGVWIDFWTHEVIYGPLTRHVEYGLDRFPLYVRANALIPTMEPAQSLTEEPWPLVTFEAYPLDAGATTLRDTDGATDIALSASDSVLEVALSGAKDVVGLRVLPLATRTLEALKLGGAPLERRDSVALQADGAMGWSLEPDGTLVALLRQPHPRTRAYSGMLPERVPISNGVE